MTHDPITAALHQLAAHHEQLTQLADLITGIGDTLREHAAALAKLAESHRHADADPDRYQPEPGRRRGGSSPPPTAPSPSPGCAPGSSRSTAPATATWPPPWPPAGTSHDLCLYGLDILSDLWSVLYLQPDRTPGLLSAQAEYQARILPALADQLAGRNHPLRPPPHPAFPAGARHDRRHPPPGPGLRPRTAGPSSPACPARRSPPPPHGYRDATTDEQQITEWFGRGSGWNLAIATGAPGPDVLDVDQHGPAGNGYPAFARLARAGPGRRRGSLRPDPGRRDARLLHRLRPAQRPPARPPPGLPLRRRLHPGPALPGRRQALPAHHQTRRPRRPGLGRRHRSPGTPAAASNAPAPGQDPGRALSHLARWVASQPEGNRNAGLFWAANRALDADPAADLSPLAAAARQAGLDEPEITRTLDSARKTSQARTHQAEAVD